MNSSLSAPKGLPIVNSYGMHERFLCRFVFAVARRKMKSLSLGRTCYEHIFLQLFPFSTLYYVLNVCLGTFSLLSSSKSSRMCFAVCKNELKHRCMEMFSQVVTEFVSRISFYDLRRADFASLWVVAWEPMQGMSDDGGNLPGFVFSEIASRHYSRQRRCYEKWLSNCSFYDKVFERYVTNSSMFRRNQGSTRCTLEDFEKEAWKNSVMDGICCVINFKASCSCSSSLSRTLQHVFVRIRFYQNKVPCIFFWYSFWLIMFVIFRKKNEFAREAGVHFFNEINFQRILRARWDIFINVFCCSNDNNSRLHRIAAMRLPWSFKSNIAFCHKHYSNRRKYVVDQIVTSKHNVIQGSRVNDAGRLSVFFWTSKGAHFVFGAVDEKFIVNTALNRVSWYKICA